MDPARIHPDLAGMAARHARTRRTFRLAADGTGRLAGMTLGLADVCGAVALVFMVHNWRTGQRLITEVVESAAWAGIACVAGWCVLSVAAWLFRHGSRPGGGA